MKQTLTIVIAFFFVLYSQAQVEIKPGIKAGVNFANLTNTNDAGINNKGLTSLHIGGTLSFKFAKFYTLQPELLFSKQGSELSAITFNDKVNVELNYLSIPVNNKFYISDSGLNFQIAPVLDILLNSKNIESPEGFDIGIIGAIGYELKNGVSFSVGYKQGLADIFGRNVNNNQSTNIDDLVLNKVIQLSAAYQFDL